jgi:adenylosuccinate lyase
MESREKGKPFAEVLAKRLGGKVSRKELERVLRPQNYLGTARQGVDRVVAELRKELRAK